VNVSGTFLQTLALTVNAATGESMIFTHCSFDAVQPTLLVSVTLIEPGPAGPHNTVTQLEVELPTIVPPTTVHEYVLPVTDIVQYVVYECSQAPRQSRFGSVPDPGCWTLSRQLESGAKEELIWGFG